MCEIFVDEVVDATKDSCRRCQCSRSQHSSQLCRLRGSQHSSQLCRLRVKELACDTMLRLMNVVQIYDLEHGCVVGEKRMCYRLSSQATRAAVHALRFEGGPRIPKLSV